MKKYFIKIMMALTVVIVGAACSSCGNDNTPPPPTPTTTTTIESPIYYGQKLSATVGFYSFVMKQGDNQLRIDLFSAVSSTLKPETFEYKLAAKDAYKKNSFFAAAKVDDAEGTLYTENGVPMLITDGVIRVTVGTGGYNIIANLKAGDKTIEMSYNGKITFVDESVDAPRAEIVADLASIAYLGAYDGSAADLGIISLAIASSSTPDEYIIFGITVDLPADADKVAMPVGTFDVAVNPNVKNKIIAGRFSNGPMFSWELRKQMIDGQAYFGGGICILDGSVTISRVGEKYTITTDLSGKKYSSLGKEGKEVKGIKYKIENIDWFPADYVEDQTRPMSSLTSSVDLTNLTKVYMDDPLIGGANQELMMCRVVLASEGLVFSLSKEDDTTIFVNGDAGDAIGVQFIANKVNTFPYGTYAMDVNYNAMDVGKTLPAVPGSIDLLGSGAGTWYMQVGQQDGSTAVIGGAGAMPAKGFTKFTLEGDGKITAEVEFYDKYDNKVTGKVTTTISELVKNTRSMSTRYFPTTDIIRMTQRPGHALNARF